jgi:hypothetical protein
VLSELDAVIEQIADTLGPPPVPPPKSLRDLRDGGPASPRRGRRSGP